MTNISTLFYLLFFLCTSFPLVSETVCHFPCSSNDFEDRIDTLDEVVFSSKFIGDIPKKITTIVIDAGHGGHDHGCSGAHSDEKEITLGIAKKLGKFISEKHPDIKVLFTRTKDEFIPLYERIDLANKNKADIFLSIHANAFSDHKVSGNEVFVMGLHTAEENLRVAQRENSAVLLENDFLENYDGYDPNSPEGQIILSMYQNVYLEKSISLAKKITDLISTQTGFINRGVKQAGFVILRKAAMPSVLIEAGFLTNLDDEKLLNSNHGQELVAIAIGTAIGEYKRETESEYLHLASLKHNYELANDKENHSDSTGEIVFSVQLSAFTELDSPVAASTSIEGQAIAIKKEDGLNKLIAGKFKTYEEASAFSQKIKASGIFDQAFVVAYLGDQRVGLNKAKKIKQSRS